jgi:hypothetical protein
MSIQQTLADHGAEPISEFARRWGITRKELERRAHQRIDNLDDPAPRENERVCEECGARVTETNSMGEVGHKWGARPTEDRCSQSQRGER